MHLCIFQKPKRRRKKNFLILKYVYTFILQKPHRREKSLWFWITYLFTCIFQKPNGKILKRYIIRHNNNPYQMWPYPSLTATHLNLQPTSSSKAKKGSRGSWWEDSHPSHANLVDPGPCLFRRLRKTCPSHLANQWIYKLICHLVNWIGKTERKKKSLSGSILHSCYWCYSFAVVTSSSRVILKY